MSELHPEISGPYQDVSDKLNLLAARSVDIPEYNEEEREMFASFVGGDEPYGIMATYNLHRKATDVVQLLRSMDDRNRFYAMKSLMNATEQAENLVEQANYYIALNAVLYTEYGGQSTDSLSEEQLDQATASATNNTISDLSLPAWNGAAANSFRLAQMYSPGKHAPNYVKTAFEFADYTNGVQVSALNYHVQSVVQDFAAEDIVTGQPAFLGASTYSEYLRMTRSLPPTVQYWYDNGLLNEQRYLSEEANDAHIFDCSDMERIVNVVLPEGADDAAFRAYKKQLESLQKGTGLPSMAETSNALSYLKQKVFREVKAAFQESTERFHPDVDAAVRSLATSALKSSSGKRRSSSERGLHDYNHLPLVRMVSLIGRTAARGGFYSNL